MGDCRGSGKLIGYVQMSDNDGRTRPALAAVGGTTDLRRSGENARGPERSRIRGNPWPRTELRSGQSDLRPSRNRNLLIRIQGGSDHKSMLEPESRRKK